jgi:hypothetical protein
MLPNNFKRVIAEVVHLEVNIHGLDSTPLQLRAVYAPGLLGLALVGAAFAPRANNWCRFTVAITPRCARNPLEEALLAPNVPLVVMLQSLDDFKGSEAVWMASMPEHLLLFLWHR